MPRLRTTLLRNLECFALICLVAGSIRAADRTAWGFRQRVAVPAAGVVKLALPRELLGASQPELADLRITDPTGREVAYLVQHPRFRPPATFVPGSIRTALGQAETVVSIETGREVPIRAVTLEIPTRQFLKPVAVAGSFDGRTWTVLRSEVPVFAEASGPRHTRIEFPPAVFRQLRVVLDDRRTAPVPVTAVVLEEAGAEEPTGEWLPVAIVDRAEAAGRSRFVLQLPEANLPVDLIRIGASEPLFRRSVEVIERGFDGSRVLESVAGEGIVFRVALDGAGAAEQMTVPVRRSPAGRELVLAFADGDSPALTVTDAQVRLRSSHLVFGAPMAGEFTLWTGNRLALRPGYDVAALDPAVQITKSAEGLVGALERNPDFRVPEALPGIDTLGAALVVGDWAVRRQVTPVGGAISSLELDVAALAGARPDLADVRLVSGGRQVPYLLDAPAWVRPLPVRFREEPDPKNPSLGRWKIELPEADVPVRELVVESESVLFERELRLFETVVTPRGEVVRSLRGARRWVRTPGASAGKLVFELDRPVTGSVLELETDNGDNAALVVSGVAATYPVRRLLFKAPAHEPVELLYGHPEVAAPRYDLGLVGRELFLAAKQPATLAPAEHRASLAPSAPGSATWLLWGALAAVVAGLLVVIAKLVPPARGKP